MGERWALLGQAIIFHLVHVHVYGVGGGRGLIFLAGLVFGMAFMRTRSILAPLVLHAGGNLIHAALFVRVLR